MAWFPVVGAALGLALGGLWWGAHRIWPPAVAAALVVAADLALTGLLHLDGLVDSADGLLPHLPPERRLEVMAEPTVGAFGVAVAAVTLLLRWVALTALAPSLLLLGGIWALSRGIMATVPALLPYARPGGLAASFLPASGSRRPALVTGAGALVLGLGGTLAWRVGPGAAVVAAELLAAAIVVGLARRRIGGFTGDVLGAAGVLAETAALLVAAARW
jgi:cobalamin 5'-phosphate synthase/cobalamin synthase